MFSMIADMIALVKPKSPTTRKWELFFSTHREYIHTECRHERVNTHLPLAYPKLGKEKVIYE
jgi:hypothetical protein